MAKTKKKVSWANRRNKRKKSFSSLPKRAKSAAFANMGSKGKLYKKTKSGTRKASLGRIRKKK